MPARVLLSEAQISRFRDALLGEDGERLIELVAHLNLGRPTSPDAERTLPLARELGWTREDDPRTLTTVGRAVADSLREYRLWTERDRLLHGQPFHERLAAERYSEKEVLEVGSGFGCNLLSLAHVPGRFVGVEPTRIYREMSRILAERANLPAPTILEGRGESLPFEDASFDVVFCYSAHQYMDIRRAFREVARVLRPGGEFQLIGAMMNDPGDWFRWIRSSDPGLRGLVARLRTCVDTHTYEWFGRRLRFDAEASTVAPVYPSRRRLEGWLRDAGLAPKDEFARPCGDDVCLVAFRV